MLFLSQRPLTRGDVDRNLFVGREEELARLGRASRLGLNVLVLGARGAGVTSLLNQHARQLEDGGRRVSLVSGTAAESLAELATAIRIGVEGRRPERTETVLRHPETVLQHPEVFSAARRYARLFNELAEVKTIPGDPDPLASLRGVEDSLSEGGSEEGTEAEGSEGRLVVILDGTLKPGLVHDLFGRLRDEVWELRWTWVVAGRLDRRGEYLEPPADAFFDDEMVLGPLEPEQARQLVSARVASATTEELADATRIRARLDQIVGRSDGIPRRLLAAARDTLLSTSRQTRIVDEALAAAASLGKTELAAMHYLLAAGPASASDAEFLTDLGVSRSRATQVFKRLEASNLVQVSEMRTARGRPRKLYRPTGIASEASP